MSRWKLLLVVAAVSLSTMAVVRERGVRLAAQPQASEPLPPFDPAQSAALFVGVSEFRDLTLNPVRYTVDDAVDLAYTLAIERNVKLVRPERVALALAGKPTKATSVARLAKLHAAGASLVDASHENIAAALQQQSHLAGSAGMLIVFFASHGFSSEGTPYILSSTSILAQRDTSLSTPKVLDVVAASRARRSLVLIDACRERLPGRRGKRMMNPANAAPLLAEMKHIAGQVVFYAAGPGSFSYEAGGNGIFTRALIEGLSCAAARTRGLVTVETLAEYVEVQVRKWIRENHDRDVVKATQVSMDPDTKGMPLTTCARMPSPARVTTAGRTVIAFAEDDEELWRAELEADVVQVEIGDLENDGAKEVLAGAGGAIMAFDATGKRVWSVDTGLPFRKFVTEHLYNKEQLQTVAISRDGESARLTIVDRDGTKLAAYTHDGDLLDVITGRLTSNREMKIIVRATDATARAQLGVEGPVMTVSLIDRPKRSEIAPRLTTLDADAEWRGALLPPAGKIARVETTYYDNDENRDIALHTSTGEAIYLDFNGHMIGRTGQTGFQLLK